MSTRPLPWHESDKNGFKLSKADECMRCMRTIASSHYRHVRGACGSMPERRTVYTEGESEQPYGADRNGSLPQMNPVFRWLAIGLIIGCAAIPVLQECGISPYQQNQQAYYGSR